MHDIEELRYLIKAVDKEGDLNYAHRLKTINITPSQYEVLKILSLKNGRSISEIGELLICGSENPSRLIDRLVAKKLVKKNNSKKDSRIVNIWITPEGQAVLKKAQIIETEFDEHITAELTKDITVQRLLKILKKQVEGTKTLAKIEKRKSIEQ